MPLIVMCGLPHSGKTATFRLLELFIREKLTNELSKWKIVVIKDTDNPSFNSNIYADIAKEKEHRGFLRSRVQNSLRSDVIVILDSCNYIKGFR